ncbi:transmembrane protein, putative (macronuclear) [Tetrahymena thermophila SB210]|uniref:Transmembrane protein, putative n=1 Tax=Tetrahymena thermophila (strain SB210) TaxID=312017 RepID=Q22YW2_TETTS|nr:transmembrane protein, putative [Tetrahymena thermophila SB210]EAR90559.2 transmembrane protein, putative [Tetrahymena thermophila SB210]|eukprot:XP_001010804.2 transmembrane protein, putative [Tetrahymena thermophila SB210]
MNFQEVNQQNSLIVSQQQKVYQDELSFLNLPALNKSFHERSSSSSSSSNSEGFDRSSESNPYGSSSSSSSSSSEDIEEAIKERIKSQKLVRLRTGEKYIRNITQILQYFLEKDKIDEQVELKNKQQLLKKLNLTKFDIIIFYLIAYLQEREEDIQILFDKLKAQIMDTREKKDDKKVNQMIYFLVEESKKKDKMMISNFIIDNASYFMRRIMEDKNIFYEIYLQITQNPKINQSSLQSKLSVSISTIHKVLQAKRYEQILYLVKNGVKIEQSSDQILFKLHDKLTYEGYLNKPLQRVDLKLIILFYLQKHKDHDLIKQLLFGIQLPVDEKVEILQALIKYKANSLSKDVFRELEQSNQQIYNETLLKYSLNVQNYDFLWFLTSQQEELMLGWLSDEETQQKLIDCLYHAEGKNFEYLIYYLKRIQLFSQRKKIQLLAETLIHRMEQGKEGQFIYTFYNPLKICLLVCELLTQIIENVVRDKSILIKAHSYYYKFAQIFCFYQNDHQLLMELLKDIDLEKRKTAYLMNESVGAIILSTQIVDDAIEAIYNGNIAPKTKLLEMFSITQNLFYQEKCEYEKYINPASREKFVIFNSSYQNHHYNYQRVVWTYNCKVRNYLDQLFTIILMIIIFANFFNIFSPQLDLQNLQSAHLSSSDFAAQEKQIINNIKSIYYQFQIWLDIIVSANFILKPIFISFFKITQKIPYDIYTHEVYGFILGLLSLFQLSVIPNLEYIQEPNRYSMLMIFRILYMGFVFIQFMTSLKSYKVTGPMITAMYQVVQECNKFSLIFIIINVGFVFTAYFSFYENTNGRFVSVVQTLLYLIEALFAQFQFSDFMEPSPVYASIFLLIFLLVGPVVFMQLLVAVLTYSFEKASRQGRIQYNVGVIHSVKYLEYDSQSGCLATLPCVGSFLNIFYIVPYLFVDKTTPLREQSNDKLRTISKALVRLGYFPIYFCVMASGVIINLICSPLFYLVNFLRIYREKSKEQTKTYKLKRLLKWLFFGYYYMVVQLYNDCKINHQYLNYGKYLNEREEQTISNSTYSIVASVAKSLYLQLSEYKTKMVLSEFLNAILKKMKIMEQRIRDKQRRLEQEQLDKDEIQAKLEEQVINKQRKLNLSKKSSSQQKKPQTTNTFKSITSSKTSQINDEEQNKNKEQNVITNSQINFALENNLVTEPAEIKESLGIVQTEQMINRDSNNGFNKTNKNDNNQSNSSDLKLEEDVLADQQKTNALISSNNKKNEQKIKKSSSHKSNKKVRINDDDFNKQGNQKKETKFLDEEYQAEQKPEKSKIAINIEGNKNQNIFNQQSINKSFKESDILINSFDLKRACLFRYNKSAPGFSLEMSLGPNKNRDEDEQNTDNPKLQIWQQLASKQNILEQSTPIQMTKTKKTTYQMWKELKKEDDQNTFGLFTDVDLLFQFLDAFVIEEQKPEDDEDSHDNYFNKNISNEEMIDMIYVENLIKLMHYYSKNDVKLARFSIVSQTVKRLFSGTWTQPDPYWGNYGDKIQN